jgi:hypothetical protein
MLIEDTTSMENFDNILQPVGDSLSGHYYEAELISTTTTFSFYYLGEANPRDGPRWSKTTNSALRKTSPKIWRLEPELDCTPP